MKPFLRLLLVFLITTSCARAGEIVLVRSDTTAAFFRANGADYERLLGAWRGLFTREAIAAREAALAELAPARSPAS